MWTHRFIHHITRGRRSQHHAVSLSVGIGMVIARSVKISTRLLMTWTYRPENTDIRNSCNTLTAKLLPVLLHRLANLRICNRKDQASRNTLTSTTILSIQAATIVIYYIPIWVGSLRQPPRLLVLACHECSFQPQASASLTRSSRLARTHHLAK